MLAGGGLALAGLLCGASWPLAADALPKPSGGEIILTISGAISHSNGDGNVFADLALLQTLPARDIVTETPWTKSPRRFTGVPVETLMEWVGARGKTIVADALNDYAVDFSIEEAVRLGAIVAYLIDGEPMFASDYGPLWIVYPFTERPELRTETYYQRSVWNLYSLTVIE
jgi:hypothetical protein